MLTKFYNHERFLTHVNEGKKIINSTKQGAENNPYKIGDNVKNTKSSTYKFEGKISDIYQQNGYYYYVVGGRTYRQKDITLK